MSYDYSQAGYSPEILEYLTGLDQQRTDLWQKYAGQNVGLDDPDILKPKQVQQEASDGFTTQYAPEDVVRAYMAQHPDNAQNNLNAGVDVRSYGDSRDPSVYDTVRLPFGDNYTFTNKATGQTYNASTPEQLQAVRQAVSGLSTIGTAPMPDSTFGGGNNTANWEIKNGSGERVAYDSPYTPSFLKQAGQMIADNAPAAIGALALGPAGWIPAALGSGGLTAAYQGAKGASLEDSLLAGLKAGATTALMANVSPYINSTLTDAGLDFPGMDKLFSPSADMWGAGAGSTVAGVPSVVNGVEQISNTFIPSAVGGLSSAAAGLIPAAFTGSTNSPSYADQPGVEEVRQTADRLNSSPAYGTPASLFSLYNPQTGPAPSESVTVSSKKLDPRTIAPNLSALAPFQPLSQASASLETPKPPAAEQPEEASTLSQVLKYSPLALALLGAAGGGGSGAADGGTGVYHAPEKLPDIFSAKLPSYNALPSYAPATANTGSNSGGAYMGEEDWYTYGRRPEKSFFSNIPGTPIGKAKGGSISARATAQPPRSLAVRGPGTGRSDDIPARLSDGEYVMDAETVALLGDGSSKAGADRLDRFRVNVRKHKGKSLAAGRFSVAAKQPEAYLKGRK